MPEILQNWLGTTLGVVLDMSPEKFGRNTKDGKLLAQLLYNYGVIPSQVLNKVKESKNYHECYSNLLVLKPWLKHIGVVQDETSLERMARGEGSASVSIFYAVYLNLERKDRLYYFSAQKERKMSEESCQKFKVNRVPERCLRKGSGDETSKSFGPFSEKEDMLEWHKQKCEDIVEFIKKTKAKFRKVAQIKPELGPVVSKRASRQPVIDKREAEAEETRGNITAFERRHLRDNPDLSYAELLELQTGAQPCAGPSLSEAKNIVSNMKRRRKGDLYARNFQQKMLQSVLDEHWKEIVEKQEKDFENAVCKNLLKQSQYEKQMASKLQLIRNQKKTLAENRRKIECLKVDQYQKEYDEMVQQNVEMRGEYWEAEEFEKERLTELHRRLYEEKLRLRRARIKDESRKIVDALVDIVMRISEVRSFTGCQVPKSFMKDLKELFFKDMPIFDLLEHYEELHDSAPSGFTLIHQCEGEDEEVYLENKEYERLKCEEADRQSVLDECDINDYLNLLGPWMVQLLFPDGTETEVKHLVLGYIVHKLLSVKYPPPNLPVSVDIKPMKPTSVIQGLVDESALEMLMELMKTCRVLIFRVDDAINFVLSAFKNELSAAGDISCSFQELTEEALRQRSIDPKEKDFKRKLQLLRKESQEKTTPEEEYGMMDKETQTPRAIPDDDPVLSQNAEIGKLAFEALGAGDPVPDAVIISAVIAYVSDRQEDYDGWAIVNYPTLYSQASDLEFFLTGFRTLPVLEETEGIEEVEGFSYRGSWGHQLSNDPFGANRVSKLVPKPDVFSVVDGSVPVPKTYFDSFIKLKKSSEVSNRHSQELSVLEKFYSDLNIFLYFEYQTLNFQTIKNLGKTMLAMTESEGGSNLAGKSSAEIFGSGIFELNDKWEPKRKNTKDVGGVKKPGPKSSEVLEEEKTEEVEKVESVREIPIAAKPGDPTWEWATGQQPESLLLALAGIWENMEAVYIEDFKNVFFCMRVHRRNVIDYCGFLRKCIRTFMRRPDEKQKVLSDFQQMFNDIDEDLRPDVDVKCELHVRVSELEQALMNIADERKKKSMNEVTKVAQDGWVSDELANLVNIFLTALQLETDRCVDSCQIISDYYLSLQQKVPEESQLVKVTVPKLQIQDRKYSVYSSLSNKTTSSSSPRNSDLKRNVKSISDQSGKFTQSKTSKTRSLNERKRRSADCLMSGAADFMTVILTNLTLPEDGMTPFHSFFLDSVQLANNEIKTLVEGCIAEAKKTEKPAPTANRQTKTKKASDAAAPASPPNEHLIAEWTTALENELSRYTFRSQLILARGIFDMNEFLTTILNILSSLTEDITEMYLKEIHSISECCQVFKCCIEEEKQVHPVLELKEDEFLVHMEDVLSPENEKSESSGAECERKRFNFTVEQLSLLFGKLQRIAPDGEIIKRSLVFIVEDLRMLKPEVENGSCFPEVWMDIDPDDVTFVFNEVYQDLEIVHWKDFIIYALELPLPTEMDILTMRRSFRKHDPLVTELINRDDYDSVTFWFENPGEDEEDTKKVKSLLFRMYQVDDTQTNYSALLLAFCKDENPVLGFAKAVTLAMGQMISLGEENIGDFPLIRGESENYSFGTVETTEKETNRKPYCCPTSSTEATVKCIPKEKIFRCECKDEPSTEVSSEEMYGYERKMENEGEYEYSGLKPFKQTSPASAIPYNILTSLLKASFPSLPMLTILLDCEQTFQETLTSIYESLDSGTGVEIQKLLSHKFIDRLLHLTNKFKFVKLKPVLLSVAKTPSQVLRVECVKDRVNGNFCQIRK